MNTLLLFFALPIATIILSIVFEKILRNPFLTAAIFFAIYLVLTFIYNDTTYLIFTIAYTILAFITAVIAEYFFIRKCMMNSISNLPNNTLNTQNVNTTANVNSNRMPGYCNRR